MTRPLSALLCLLFLAYGCAGEPPPDPALPNLIIILADDLGYGDVGCYWQRGRSGWGRRKIDTPNIDRMADEGIRFTDFYVAASVCTPSRAALLTGSHPLRIGLGDLPRGVLYRNESIGLNPDEVTLAEALRDKGYATACIGKWHLGDAPMFYPTRHGFDTHYGTEFIERDARTVTMSRDEVPADEVKLEDVTERYTEEAIDFIDANRNRPFFLYLSHNAPHVPLAASKDFKGKSRRGLYGDVVMCLDWSVGAIIERLERLGIDERTLVVFTSDNGPATTLQHEGGLAYPMRGGKGFATEGGFRVPCIMWWPGTIPAGVVTGEIVTAMDITPTFCELTGASLAPGRKIDGENILPIMMNEPGAVSPHRAFYYYQHADLRAVRSGQWKLVFDKNSEEDAEAGEPPPVEVFDLANDISEYVDILTDIDSDRKEALAIRNHLLRLADITRRDLGDANVGEVGRNVRPPGTTEGP